MTRSDGRWPVGEAWVYDSNNNYLGKMTYFDEGEMLKSTSYLESCGYLTCPRLYNIKEEK
jgi:hypothetical protein